MNVMLNSNLVTAENNSQLSAFAFQSDEQYIDADQIAKKVDISQFIEKNFYDVSVEWSQFWTYSHGRLSATFAKLIEYCEETGKDELIICNIAPASSVGAMDASAVIAAQEAIVALVYDAATKLGKAEPESRLNLRRGEYDIRFYLGDQKPTDYSPVEDERSLLVTEYEQ